jgi:hypothetical protein
LEKTEIFSLTEEEFTRKKIMTFALCDPTGDGRTKNDWTFVDFVTSVSRILYQKIIKNNVQNVT